MGSSQSLNGNDPTIVENEDKKVGQFWLSLIFQYLPILTRFLSNPAGKGLKILVQMLPTISSKRFADICTLAVGGGDLVSDRGRCGPPTMVRFFRSPFLNLISLAH